MLGAIWTHTVDEMRAFLLQLASVASREQQRSKEKRVLSLSQQATKVSVSYPQLNLI